MRILLVSQYFWPESFRINDLALTLKERGYDVTVLTGKPNYPKGRFYPGYNFINKGTEIYEGIKIIRVPLIPRGRSKGLSLILNYFSFPFFASIFSLFYWRKFDVSISFCPSPIISAIPAILHKKIHRYKTFTWVQDLWPESVTAAAGIDNKLVISSLNSVVNYIYRNSDLILVQSEKFIGPIKERIKNQDKIKYIPNWAEDIFTSTDNIDRGKFKNKIPDGFIIMFAGNIGEAQDFDSILEAALLLKENKKIKWLILGDGRNKDHVAERVKSLDLSDSIIFLGSYPLSDMPSFFIHADVMLVTLKKGEIFSMTIPSKIQSYMAAGKPIVSMLDGIGSEVINQANCGLTASSGDYKNLAQNILKLYNLNKLELKQLGTNSKNYYSHYFSKEMVVCDLENLMKSK